MLVAAVSDVHYPKFFKEFLNSLNSLEQDVKFFILAGDIVNKGDVAGYKVVVNKIKEKFSQAKILACFGNEEYEEAQEALRKIREVKFLEEETFFAADERGKKIAFIGTRGVLDKPTSWQKRNIPDITEIYEKRREKIKFLLEQARKKAELVVFFSHYAPTYLTLEGEPRTVWPSLGSKFMEEVLLETLPDLVIHGHAHHGKNFSFLSEIPIYNVALPLTKKITVINLEKLGGLKRFW